MGGVKKYFEEVAENETLPGFQITVSRTHIVKFAGAGGDMNPIHHDEAFAKSIGLPSVFAMGMMHGSYLARVLTDWAGAGCVRRYNVRFQAMVWPDDTLNCTGRVLKCYREKGENLVDCELLITNQNGETAIAGDATVALSSKSIE